MNEWEFTALAAQWITGAIDNNRDLPFREARCEQQSRGALSRRDLTLLDKDGIPVLTGEVKMPYRPDGGSPLRASVVRDARSKAERAGVEYFFTWNVNRLALFPTAVRHDDPPNAAYREWRIIDIHREAQINLNANRDQIRKELVKFLHEFTDILRGDNLIVRKPPDLRFIDAIEAELEQPILNTADALAEKSKLKSFRNALRQWMVVDQGWTIADVDDRQGVLTDLNRAAKFANYSLLNRLVFYEALLKRYGDALRPIEVPDHIVEADRLRIHFEGYFAKAREVTRDYETVFGEDPTNIGHRIPFQCDPAVAYWRQLVSEIHEFDFSRLDYEVIGSIFERLISPEERHKFGQYYTRAEVVDLINSFCIRNGSDTVMDPACGGGTFLVRAYGRKRELSPGRTHAELLRDLYGADISTFATHLTTINLATRDLIDDDNYPQIARSDFFDIDPASVILRLPTNRVVTGGLGSGQQREVEIPLLDAIVGNPPYVRQEGILKSPKRQDRKDAPPRGTKEFYRSVSERGNRIKLSGRSDLHVYFWLHAAHFLKDGDRLGLLTSSQWLDVEYGFRLQDFILQRFVIDAVFESRDEPWFVGARVATVATLLRRVPLENEKERMGHLVRFVQLRQPMEEVLEHDGTGAGAVEAADAFRDHILSLEQDTITDRYRCRVVRQGDLWNAGVRLGYVLGKSPAGPAEEPSRQTGEYYGGKWGMHLRAPDVWFELTSRYEDRFTPLGEIADIKFGVKSGKDVFFFPIDDTSNALKQELNPQAFEAAFGVSRENVEAGKVKVVRCGDQYGEVMPLEASVLEPEIHSLMEIDGFKVIASQCKRMILLTGVATSDLPPYAQQYIRWGEQNGWHEGSTCAARATATRAWHDLTGHKRGDLLWPMQQQYKHPIALNGEKLICNHNLFDIHCSADPMILGGILNSTVTIVAKYIFGRPVGVEGNLKTEVVDVKMMLVPDPRKGRTGDLDQVAAAFQKMTERKAVGFVSERRLRRDAYERKGKQNELAGLDDRTELDMPDRLELDNAVLKMLGVKRKAEREDLIRKLYEHVRQHFEWTRLKEEKAIGNKKRAKKKGPAGPTAIAAEVAEQIRKEHPSILRSWDRDFLKADKEFVTYEVPTEGVAEFVDDLIHPNTVRFMRGSRSVGEVAADSKEHAQLLLTLATAGVRGYVRVPLDPNIARALHKRFADWWVERTQMIRSIIAERTRDEDLLERALESITPLLPAA